MSTIEGAIKGAVVASGVVGSRVWRGHPADGETLPYVTFYGPLALVPSLSGDGRTIARSRQMQLDLWHDGFDEEAAGVAFQTLLNVLDGLRVPSTPKSFRIRVSLAVNVPDRKLVHHSFTLVVDHGVT